MEVKCVIFIEMQKVLSRQLLVVFKEFLKRKGFDESFVIAFTIKTVTKLEAI